MPIDPLALHPDARVAGREDELDKVERDARRFADQAADSARRHAARLRALEPVFGPAVRAATEEHLERLTESSSEAIWHLSKALELVKAREERLAELLAFSRQREEEAGYARDTALLLPRRVLEQANRYFDHTRRRRPKWLVELARDVAEIAAEEPF